MKIVTPSVTLLWSTPNPATVIEAAGRTCYQSMPNDDGTGGFIAMLIRRGHESVLEHASASFRITCDRGVSHELVRHRIASYSQESTRYCNYSADRFGSEISVIEPPGMDCVERNAWVRSCAMAESAYVEMTANGCQPQIARSVLPTCLKTVVVMTANFREWRHVLTLRCAPAAHPQMRQVAEMIRQKMVLLCEPCFADIPVVAF